MLEARCPGQGVESHTHVSFVEAQRIQPRASRGEVGAPAACWRGEYPEYLCRKVVDCIAKTLESEGR